MSERGSFITEYIYCSNCFEKAKQVLLARDKYLCSVVLPSWAPGDDGLPIIAGKCGEAWQGGEFSMFENALLPELAALICHPLRIAVLAESGERLYTVHPAGEIIASQPVPLEPQP